MANMPVEEKVFQLKIDVAENGIVTKTLATADTYVDKNIKVTVNTPDAEFEVKRAAAVTATASTNDTTYTSDTVTAYPITIAADATAGAVQVGVKTAGFAALSDVVEVESADAVQNTKTIYVKEGHLAGSGEAKAESESVTLNAGTSTSTGFVIKATAAGGASVDRAGWLPVGASADASGDAYYTLDKVNFANTGDESATDITDDVPALIEDGYLYISEGYIKDSRIALSKLVPDGSNLPVEGTESDLMYKTVRAYNNDGKLIAGTMQDATLSAITADDVAASISSVTVTEEGGVFKVTGTGAITGTASVAIATRGLAETTLSKESDISGTADVDATLNTIGLSIDAVDSLTVTPEISKESSTALSGDITTTQPTGRYIAVSAAAIAASAEISPKVATEGYGTTDKFDASGITVTAGSAASGTYYVPVQAGSHTAEAGDTTVVNATATVTTEAEATEGFDGNLAAGILSTAPATGEYITISGDATSENGSVSGVVTCTATEGYIEAAQQTASVSGNVAVEVTAAANKYIRVYDGTIL